MPMISVPISFAREIIYERMLTIYDICSIVKNIILSGMDRIPSCYSFNENLPVRHAHISGADLV